MASSYDSTNIKVYDNKVLETKLENQLITALDMSNYITTDYSLSATPGMKIEIHKYSGTGDVEDVEMGEGNTGDIGAGYTSVDYEVITTQGRVPYFDEQVMNDPVAIDKAIQHLSEQMTNDLTEKIVAELNKATNIQYGATFSFANVVDAIASFPDETVEGMFMLVNKADLATIRKNLKDDLKYVEAFVRTGYVGTVCGVPVIMTASVPAGTAFIATKEAVTAFVKKGSEVEQERDANIRKTTIYGRKVMVIALTDDSKVVKLTTASAPVVGG